MLFGIDYVVWKWAIILAVVIVGILLFAKSGHIGK